MPWDPFNAWPEYRRWIWLSIAAWLVLLRGPAFVDNLRVKSPEQSTPNFFQEYASGRNWLEGISIYSDHRETVPRYLHSAFVEGRSYVFANAHPPTSVLISLPFAKLNFADSFVVWNSVSLCALIASLWIAYRQLKIELRASSAIGLISLLLLCHPLWEQCRLGQLSLILLFLVTASWAAERSGRPLLSGVLLGTAASIKLFPAFLFLYFALRANWKVVIAGTVAILGLTAVTIIVLGFNCYRDYFLNVLPEIQWFRVGWNNDSVWGFWSRLFDPAPERARVRSLTDPLFYSPFLAKMLSLFMSAALIGIVAWNVRRDATGQRSDLTYATAVIGMLLISPVCWNHYLLILLVPLAIIWIELPSSMCARALFLLILTAFWIGYPVVWTVFDLNGRIATPLDHLFVLSYQFYALLGLFGLALVELRLREFEAKQRKGHALEAG